MAVRGFRAPASVRRRRPPARSRRDHYSPAIMRLLFVLDQWPELSETFVVNELAALRRLGHDVGVQAVQAGRARQPRGARRHRRPPARPRRARAAAARPAVARLAPRRWPARAISPAGGAGAARSGREPLRAARAGGAAAASSAATSTCTRTSPPAPRSTRMRLAALRAPLQRHRARLRHLPDADEPAREARARRRGVHAAATTTSRYLRELASRRDLHKIVMGVDADGVRARHAAPAGRTVLASGGSSRRRASTC